MNQVQIKSNYFLCLFHSNTLKKDQGGAHGVIVIKICMQNKVNFCHKYGYVENRRKLVSGKKMNTLEFYSVILLLQTNCSICGCMILYLNKHVIVHSTEVLVSYIPKFNALSIKLVYCWNFSRDSFNICLLQSMVIKKELDMSLKSGTI